MQFEHDRFEEEPEQERFEKEQLEIRGRFEEEELVTERHIEEKRQHSSTLHGDEVVSALREITGVLNTLVRRVESAENELKVVKQKIATSPSSSNESSASVCVCVHTVSLY